MTIARSRKRVLATCLLLASHLQAALGQSLPDPPVPPGARLPTPAAFAEQQMLALDKNRNGRVTWEEFSADLRRAFREMDVRRRGYLTRDDILHAYERALGANGLPIPKE